MSAATDSSEAVIADDRLHEDSDGHLAILLARGDRAALAEIYSRYGSSVYWLVLQLCGEERTAHVVQDVFLGLWHDPAQYDPERGALGTFLLRTARRRALEVLGDNASGDSHWDSSTKQSSVVELIDRSGSDALSALPTAECDAVILAFFSGYTYHEIAVVLGAPEGRVRALLSGALVRLREQNGFAGASD